MTPQHLHATANLWSLTAIWPSLLSASTRSSGATGEDRGTLQAWRPSSGVQGGRTGDQILEAILRSSGSDANPYLERAERTAATVTWLAAQVVPPAAASTGEALREMLAGLTDLRPSTALNLAMHIGAEDRAVRKLLGEPDDLAPIPGVACPRCDSRTLAIRTSNPDRRQRPIVCAQPACQMADAIPSIWTSTQLESALATKDAA